MFVGHYSVSFAAKAHRQEIPLWLLFIAVQLIDVLWSVFVLLGIEKVRIVPGFTKTNALDLYYMPYTHSLVGAAFWSLAAGAVCVLVYRWKQTAGVVVGAAVFSHWVFDLLVHKPDLALYDSRFKMGLGLWDYKWLEFGLEVLILAIGIYMYMRFTRATNGIGRYGFIVFAVAMLVTQASQFYMAPPPSGGYVAVMALLLYALFAAIAGRLEKKTRAKTGIFLLV